KAHAVLSFQPLGELDEAFRAHPIDVGERAARERRKAEADDRADIGLPWIGDHALFHRARRLKRLSDEEALLELVLVDRVGIEMHRLELLEPRPELLSRLGVFLTLFLALFLALLRIIVKPLGVLAAEASMRLDHGGEKPLLHRI